MNEEQKKIGKFRMFLKEIEDILWAAAFIVVPVAIVIIILLIVK